MFRNGLSIIGALALLAYFKPFLAPRIPLLGKLPLPEISFKSGEKTPEKTANNSLDNPNNPTPQNSPSPSPSPEAKKRWGLEFEYKGRVGL